MKNYDNIGMLAGKAEIVSKFEETSLGLNKSETHYIAVLKEMNPLFETDKNIIVNKASIEDIEDIANLKERIEEFTSGSYNFKEIGLWSIYIQTER